MTALLFVLAQYGHYSERPVDVYGEPTVGGYLIGFAILFLIYWFFFRDIN
jgi:hypothetical protein